MNRTVEKTIKFLLDECIPPVIRDSKLFMKIPLMVAFRKKNRHFLSFKEKVAFCHSESFFSEIYRETGTVSIQSEGTDLSDKAMDLIKKEILGTRVLDAGCGKGRLASILSEDRSVTACDIVIDKKTIEQYPEISFHETDICSLPFSDKQFETVTCTHTLEHIWDIESAVKELRRVAEKRLIIVVPKERPYKYAFNLHLHFFTFPYQVIRMFSRDGNSANRRLEDLGNCWYCREDL